MSNAIYTIGFEEWLEDNASDIAQEYLELPVDTKYALDFFHDSVHFRKEVMSIWEDTCEAYEAANERH